MNEEATTLKDVLMAVKDTVTDNIGVLWEVAAAVVGAIAVLWFARLGLRTIKALASSAAS